MAVTLPETFAAIVAEEQHMQPGRDCGLGKAVKSMTPDLATDVRGALNSPSVSAAAISRALKRFGYELSEGQVRRCRRTCNCWKADQNRSG